jgi:glyoxylase I family protein
MLDVHGLVPLLQVYDMPTAVRFYRDRLGFEVMTTSPPMGEDYFHWCLLRLGEAKLMLNTAYEFNEERPPQREPSRPVGHRDVGLYFSCPAVEEAYKAFRAKGVATGEIKVARYGMKQLYLLDPDGYQLCFQWPAENNSE